MGLTELTGRSPAMAALWGRCYFKNKNRESGENFHKRFEFEVGLVPTDSVQKPAY